ncbi:Uncharacterised protein (plasmid) [Tsukamurella tyrosinosolvens]|uniref:Uncharacterized protein n=2 Tax=Tsukamurella tyrosinosolvens TaxID=57704 RepID=A0A1H4VSI1_TSUTY|nr:hypothetical protein AXK58_22835 [Tsukamurella tyrosinosolvens]SEC84072.1 hypothetical protein SAMN04489793_3326 [Tsukamurella tyrosinosolvens]VEH90318.1 Uncharacterised protein [Tsukamurella tyrosinosolvens]
MEDFKVHIYDRVTAQWLKPIDVTRWPAQYKGYVEQALEMHAESFGGALTIAGTLERGELRLVAPEGAVLADFRWLATESHRLDFLPTKPVLANA